MRGLHKHVCKHATITLFVIAVREQHRSHTLCLCLGSTAQVDKRYEIVQHHKISKQLRTRLHCAPVALETCATKQRRRDQQVFNEHTRHT